MAVKTDPKIIQDAFDLYLQFNGERFDLLEIEMRRKGWTSFSKQVLFNRGKDKNFREGWIERFGWKTALELKVAVSGKAAATSAESLLFEADSIRKKLWMAIESQGVLKSKDLIYQHKMYVAITTDILAKLEAARDNYANFNYFLEHLLAASTQISPALAKELCDAEEALLEWAEREFVNEDND